jgi:hypothetical protein
MPTTVTGSLVCDRKGCGFHNPPDAGCCEACGWTLSPAAGASKPAAAPPAADGAGLIRTVTGVVTQGPRSAPMRAPRPFWIVVVAVLAVGGPYVVQFLMANATLLVIGALLVALAHGGGGRKGPGHAAGSMARRARRHARAGGGLSDAREGVVFRLSEDGGRTWMVSLLPREQARLAMGDRVTVTGHRTAGGELRAWKVQIERTGTTVLSAVAVNAAICAAALLAIVVALG